MRLVLFGAPGSGKGTQASLLTEEFELFHLSTGDVLRKAIADKTALGTKAQGYMDAGQLVPDELVIGIVQEAISKLGPDKGFILDGFPRTLKQAKSLDSFLQGLDLGLSRVISLEVGQEELVNRICARAEASETKRADDNEETVRERLKAFENQTLPLKEYYAQRQLLSEVNGVGEINAVYELVKLAAQSV